MTTALLLAPIGLPLFAALAFAVAGWRRLTASCAIVLAVASLAAAAVLAGRIRGGANLSIAGGHLRADALTAWMLLVVGAVSLLAMWASPAYLAAGHASRRRSRWYGLLLNLFAAAMAVAVLSGNLGVLWVAIEATTVVTAFLVGHHGTRTALEAAWKYVLICSAAIAVAFLGLVLLYYAARHAGLDSAAALDWTVLTAHAHQLDPAVTRIALGLLVLGFGAKAGLIPLHAWLPDAHSQAPAPVSAMMSGVLLSVAFYAVLRFKAFGDVALGPGFLRTLLLIIALTTLALAAVLLVGQHDLKRMLAYSSMEHMGLIALGAAVGSRLALAAILLHMAGHGLAKAVAFVSSGYVMHRYRSSSVADVRGLAATAPTLAAVFGLAVAALLGFPPAALFASEIGIARAGADAGLGWATAAGFLLALLAFAAITERTARMLLGPARHIPVAAGIPAITGAGGPVRGGLVPILIGADKTVRGGTAPPSVAAGTPVGGATRRMASPGLTLAGGVPLMLGLAGVAALGVSAGPLAGLLHSAASVLAP